MATSASSSLSDRSNSVSKNMTFRKASCLADERLTPPSSPDAPRQRTTRTGPRLHLSRLLRRPKGARPNKIVPPSRSRDQPFLSTTMEPFPLLLPDSPADTDTSLTCTVSPVDPPELRRVSASYPDLRSLAVQQSAPKLSQPATPLLPSPITHDLFEQDDRNFRFHNPRLPRSDAEYKSYDDMHILSCYYDDSRTESMNEIERELNEDSVSEASLSPGHADDFSTASEDTPQTPKDREPQTAYCSPESDWLANETTPSERLRRFKARCYQVVQHPRDESDKRKDENGILLATVLGIARKPKLVQISRPSSDSSPRASRTDQIRHPPQTPTQYPPEVSAFSPYDTPGGAPEQLINPSPALSSDSLGEPGPSFSSLSLIPAPLSLMTHSYNSSSTAFSNTRRRQLEGFADPFGRSLVTRSRCPSDQKASLSALPDRSTKYQPTARHGVNPGAILNSNQIPTANARLCSLENSKGSWRERNDLARMVETLCAAIDAFTFSSSLTSSSAIAILHLSSPVVNDLRCPRIDETHYIWMIGKIFPFSSTTKYSNRGREDLLNSLAAWILVDLYLTLAIVDLQVQLQQNLIQPNKRSSHVSFTFPLPPKLVTSLSLGDVALRRRHSSESHQEQETGTKRPPKHKHQFSYTSIINQSNSSLHRIPTKARDLLGITHSPSAHQAVTSTAGNIKRKPVPRMSQHTHCEQPCQQTAQEVHELLQRTIAVQQSASVIGGSLMQALRGKEGFDEDIWRSLRVLIEVVEKSGWERMDCSTVSGDRGSECLSEFDSEDESRPKIESRSEHGRWF